VHVVAARLGHADPSVTLRVYAHAIQDLTPAVADIFARAVLAASKAEMNHRVSKGVSR
jgi:integrase